MKKVPVGVPDRLLHGLLWRVHGLDLQVARIHFHHLQSLGVLDENFNSTKIIYLWDVYTEFVIA